MESPAKNVKTAFVLKLHELTKLRSLMKQMQPRILQESNMILLESICLVELFCVGQHSLAGCSTPNLFDNTLELEEPVDSHHEIFDGKGYPDDLLGSRSRFL